METPKKVAPPELLAFMAELNNELKKDTKKPEPAHKALNREWHEKNRPLDKTSGKSPERLNPEDSTHWRPEAKVTHLVKQFCSCCGDHVDFIGGEYIRFRSVMPFGGVIKRRTENCPNLWLFDSIEEPIREEYEQHVQEVTRCVGCIKVEQQAVEIWEQALDQQRDRMRQLPLIDITLPIPQAKKPTEELIVRGL
jgi:hypothetical protein